MSDLDLVPLFEHQKIVEDLEKRLEEMAKELETEKTFRKNVQRTISYLFDK